MIINGVGKSEIQSYRNNSKAEQSESSEKSSKSKKTATREYDGTVHFETAKTVAGIASKYQIRHSTAKEMASMSEELHNAGLISQDEHQSLSYKKDFHFDYYDFADTYTDIDIEPSPKRDFIKVWEETLSIEVQNNNTGKAEKAGRIVNILQNLDLVDAGPLQE